MSSTSDMNYRVCRVLFCAVMTCVLSTEEFVQAASPDAGPPVRRDAGRRPVARVPWLERSCDAPIVGDAVGLATRDLCEGIGPAIRSGHLAAESILTGSEYSLQAISAHSAEHAIVRKLLEYMFVKRRTRPAKSRKGKPPGPAEVRQQAQ